MSATILPVVPGRPGSKNNLSPSDDDLRRNMPRAPASGVAAESYEMSNQSPITPTTIKQNDGTPFTTSITPPTTDTTQAHTENLSCFPSPSDSTNDNDDSLDGPALLSLAAQHFSSAWSDRTAEFALYLFLITLFPTTLLPSSLFGFFTTGFGILFSGHAGALVDSWPRLRLLRGVIVVQKSAILVAYGALLVMAVRLRGETEAAGEAVGKGGHALVWVFFTVIVISGCLLKLSTVCLSVAIERDWATVISIGSSARLTRLNLWFRRIDLGCKLVSPLVVSGLAALAGDVVAIGVMMGIAGVGMGFELVWIGVVWRRMPVLGQDEVRRNALTAAVGAGETHAHGSPKTLKTRLARFPTALGRSLTQTISDWRAFIQTPVFPTSLSISLLYFTVLSFDGTMISWLKTETYSDGLIAGMRGVGVVTGLMGTFAMPWMEKRIGLVRAGGWSIWSEVLSLLPVLLSFYLPTPQPHPAPQWNQLLLFGGMALSRIGLWAFDLCQLKQLQMGLAEHPRRNALSGLQFALMNGCDLGKFVMTIVLSQPSQFRYCAAASFGAVLAAALSYSAYMRKERGHLLHTAWAARLLKKEM